MELAFHDLAREHQVQILTDFLVYGTFCAEHAENESMALIGPGQQDFSGILLTGFRDWLPWPFILAVRVAGAGQIPRPIVEAFMKGGRSFLRFFARPHRISLMRPTSSGWYESSVILPRNALELFRLRRLFAEHLREQPKLDRGYDD